jgi:hypothetical protein
MGEDQYQEFVRLVHNRAGDTFRSAWTYNEDDWRALYVRDDIRTEELRAAISQLVQRVREHDPIIHSEAYAKMGDVEATVELHTDAVLLHFWEAEATGVVVTLDQEASQDLAGFVEHCNSVLKDER